MAGEIRRLFFADGVAVTAAVDAPLAVQVSVALSAESTKTVDVSAVTTNASKRIWQVKKPSGDDYEQIQCTITTPSETSVYLDFGGFAKTGTFLLIGA